MTVTPEPPEILSFGPVAMIRGRRQGKYPYCHTLLVGADELAVIDPSADKETCRRLAQDPRLRAVVVSHFHEDHQKYLSFFPDERLWVPAAETAAFASLAGVMDFLGIEDPTYLAYWKQILVSEFHFRPRLGLQTFTEGTELRINGTWLQVLHTPGHTPGHSCVYFPDQGILYLADMDLTPFGPWYGDATSDLEALLRSLDRLEKIPVRLYLTAHGQGVFPAAAGQQALGQFRQVIFAREAALLELLSRPRTLEELVRQRLIYRKDLEPQFVYDHIERQMLQKHLQRLLHAGHVKLTEEGYVATRRSH